MTTPLDIVRRFAPIFDYPNENSFGGFPHDHFPTTVDFDGNWDVTDNADHFEQLIKEQKYQPKPAIPPSVYYGVAESATHYFLTYYLYYPRDPVSMIIGHDNDASSMMMVVKKGSTPKLEWVVSSDHGDPEYWQPSESDLTEGRVWVKVTDTHSMTPTKKMEPALPEMEKDSFSLIPEARPMNGSFGYDLVSVQSLWDERFNQKVFCDATPQSKGKQYCGGRGGWAPWARKFVDHANAFLAPAWAFAPLYVNLKLENLLKPEEWFEGYGLEETQNVVIDK